MNKYSQLVIGIIKMLVRDRMALIGSFGVAFVSMFLFGWLFGAGGGATKLNMGIVNEDNSPASTAIVEAMKKSDALEVTTGDRDFELGKLREGNRRAVLVLAEGFERDIATASAKVKVYYDESNPTGSAIASSAGQAMVGGINKSLTGVKDPISIEREGITSKQLSTMDFLAPGLVGMMIMWANLFVGAGLIAWRERGILKRLGATALRPFELVSAQVAAHMVFSLIQAALLLAIGVWVFDVSIQGSYLLLALAVA